MNPEIMIQPVVSQNTDALPCLKQLVEAVNDGTVDAGEAGVFDSYELGSAELYPSRYGCPSHTNLTCGVKQCNADATVQSNSQGSYINLASFHIGEQPCSQENPDDEVSLPNQTDKYSCLSTSTSYALRKFGIQYESKDVDLLLQRSAGKPPTSEGMIALHLALLERDYQLKLVLRKDSIDVREYL